jgi:hypothetical protein
MKTQESVIVLNSEREGYGAAFLNKKCILITILPPSTFLLQNKQSFFKMCFWRLLGKTQVPNRIVIKPEMSL